MKPERPAKHFILAFLLALAGYIVCYQSIEYRRTRNGPWRVTFTTDSNDVPTILIDQPRLAITNVQIRFTGKTLPATNRPVTLLFGQPRAVPYEVPFGKCVFMDTTFLPGTVTFQLFGHEIELLPRVLVIDRQERRWRSGTTMALPHAPAAPALTHSHENKCASPYIGERFGEKSIGGKWLLGGLLRIPLTLMGHGNGAVEGCNYFAELL